MLRTLLTAILACAPLSGALYAQIPVLEDNLRGDEKGFMDAGKVFVHTARNGPVMTLGGQRLPIRQGDLLDAEDIAIETSEGQCLTLVFSNKFTLYVDGASKFSIEKFDQVQPFPARMPRTDELTRSNLRLGVESGDFYFFGLRGRALSKIIVKTPFGIFEPQSRSFRMLADPDSVRLDLPDGQARFYTYTGKSDFLQTMQSARADAESASRKYPLLPTTLDMLVADGLKKKLNYAKFASESVYFTFAETGRLSARRVVPEAFFIRKPRYDHRF